MKSLKPKLRADPEDDEDGEDPVGFWVGVVTAVSLAILISKTVYEGLGGVWTLW